MVAGVDIPITKSTDWSNKKLNDPRKWTDRGNGFVVEYAVDEKVPLEHREDIAEVGVGGIVQECYCPMLRKGVAVKKVTTRGKKKANDDLTKEVGYLRTVRHYHCVQVLGSYIRGSFFCIVMEPVATCDLREYLEHDGPPHKIRKMEEQCGPRTAFLPRLMGCLAHGLHYLHQKSKLRHRDIKPANILLDGPTVLFTDFNLSKVFTETQTGTSGPSLKTLMVRVYSVRRLQAH